MFRAVARLRAQSPPILSRHRQGRTCGLQVDDARMGGLRTDLSFTPFPSGPETCDGGGPVIGERLESRAVRLAAGDALPYPSTPLHRVAPVTRGERLAVAGWAQGLTRSAGARDILFDLDRASEAVRAAEGRSALSDRLARARSDLLRLRAETRGARPRGACAAPGFRA